MAPGRLAGVTAHETPHAPAFAQITRPEDATGAVRRDLGECWAAVINAGGAVIPMGCPLPPVSPEAVDPALDAIVQRLAPRRGRLLLATVEGTLAGWVLLSREPHPLEAHCGTVNHLQTHVRFRRRGVGAALMRRLPDIARDEMGMERLRLTARAGLGLEDFYGRVGWTEVGRWPGALRVAPGDDRDEILMSLAL
ncbi:putative acetyltransferase [Streptomyces ambofaciens ATCC 23877]|uniref:Putative acetyltransferase n=1 Tax=Streptomyces ambofaciens (strain ATCC 23877 / 3486 / DSM 40053 / JCM 4204 / NBRC 12836 / NRRL B-2516) TaxID=278992 RepID=A0A0K2AL33_STRA7|nr:putative acetyltransferase [Streptomyces ambofaciens ATCC 23877]